MNRVYGSVEPVDIRNLRKFAGLGLLALSLSACAPGPDPFLETVTTAVAKTVFKEEIASSSGCIQLSGIFCQQPMYDLVFAAPADLDSRLVCTEFFNLAKGFGAVAYSLNDGTGNAAKLPTQEKEVIDLCEVGLAKPLTNFDGSFIYQGLALYDDGAKDEIGKYLSLGRGVESADDKRFNLTISFSKDLSRVGPISYGTEKPKLRTQADIDAANEQNELAVETMKTANTLLGMKESEAIAKIESAGFAWVVVDRDGEEFITDASYNPKRIRLTIRDAVIYDAIAG